MIDLFIVVDATRPIPEAIKSGVKCSSLAQAEALARQSLDAVLILKVSTVSYYKARRDS